MEKNIQKSIQKYPLIIAVITQVIVLFILRNFFWLTKTNITLWSFVFLQGLLSAVICQLIFKLPRWFIVISLLFPICFSLAWSYLHISSTLYGVAFIVLALTFSHTLKERVPLYLSNNTTHEGLKKIIETHQSKKVLDLGSGLGGVVRALSSKTVDSHGVESAPFLWLYSSAWSKLTNQGSIHRQNIWHTQFAEFDFIYAFLSPAIMEKLFQKVAKEMKPGSVFVSNSFAVPGIPVSEIRVLCDSRETKLYIYKM